MNSSVDGRVARSGAVRATAALAVAAALLAVSGAPARADVFQVSYEAAGVQSANQSALCANVGAGVCTIGVESFDTRLNNAAFSTSFGTGGTITGSYSSVQVNAADQYGGAGAVGKYAVAFNATPYSVTLATTLSSGINYFGFWLSALDLGNQVAFYKGATLVYSFTPSDLIKALGSCSASNAYCGNPNPSKLGQNSGQLYAFVNFRDSNGTFDRVSFQENPASGGYESDNHTVGYVTAVSGTVVSVAEPSTMAVLSIGLLGLLGFRRAAQGRPWPASAA